MSQTAGKPPLGGSSIVEIERNKSLFKQARGVSTGQLILAHLISAGVVILVTYLGTVRSGRFEPLPWLVCSGLVFVLATQFAGEMHTNKRLDALLTMLIRKRLFDDEVTDTQLMLDLPGSAARRTQP